MKKKRFIQNTKIHPGLICKLNFVYNKSDLEVMEVKYYNSATFKFYFNKNGYKMATPQAIEMFKKVFSI